MFPISYRHLSTSVSRMAAASQEFADFATKTRKVLGAAMNYM